MAVFDSVGIESLFNTFLNNEELEPVTLDVLLVGFTAPVRKTFVKRLFKSDGSFLYLTDKDGIYYNWENIISIRKPYMRPGDEK